MTRPPLILSAGIADARLSDPDWADEMVGLADGARIDLLLLGDGGAVPFEPLVIAHRLAPRAGAVGLVPTLDSGRDLPPDVARALSALAVITQGRTGWQPTTLAQSPTSDSVPRGVDFVAATRSLWDNRDADALLADPADGRAEIPQENPLLVQSDADPLWSQVAADVVIIDMDSPRPPRGPKVLLRTFTALAGLDQIEQLYRDDIVDGIHLTPPYPRRGLQEFADTMLPALIERGLIPATRPSGTLRERLGLPDASRRLRTATADRP